MKRKRVWGLGEILQKIASKIEAKVLLEPNWKTVGRIVFKNGKHSYFRYNTLDINPMGASEIAKDKDYANFFIQKLGYKIVPKSKTFFSKDWCRAIGAPDRDIDQAFLYANKIGFPVVVKPNSGSQGKDVAFVQNKKEFYRALNKIFRRDRIAIVQKPVYGKDYRLVVLDNKVISAYERIPLSITGDGKSNILELLEKKIKKFKKEKRDVRIKITDERIINKLKHQNLNLHSILNKNESVFLLDNANLSSGGDSIDVTNVVNKEFKNIAVDLAKKMGLKLCGVDLIVGGNISDRTNEYWILEINSAPGLDNYAKSGSKQKEIVENLYLEVLKKIEEK